MAGALRLRNGKKDFRKRFKLALRREWYPTLKAPREKEDASQRRGILEAWQSLGNAMDLDETRERQEYEYELKHAEDRRCSWHECEYQSKRPPKTRVCVGCNEVVSVIPGGMSMLGARATFIKVCQRTDSPARRFISHHVSSDFGPTSSYCTPVR